VVLAEAKASLSGAGGLTLLHAYVGRAVGVPAGAPAQRLGSDSNAPGSWPQSFVDFHGRTGLHSYWYSSGASIDYRKPPDTVYISWDAARPIDSSPGAPDDGSSGGGAWKGSAATSGGGAQGGADTPVHAADPWDLVVQPVLAALKPPDLVPPRKPAGGAAIVAQAAIITLLVSASTALIAWRRGWFRLQPKGIIP
jgi:hypothetical protein